MPPTGSTHVHPDSAPIDALAAAAAEAARGTPSGEQPSGSAGKEGSGDWTFPVFVGHRRRLPPDDVLFEAGNIEREALVRQVGAGVVLHGTAARVKCGALFATIRTSSIDDAGQHAAGGVGGAGGGWGAAWLQASAT